MRRARVHSSLCSLRKLHSGSTGLGSLRVGLHFGVSVLEGRGGWGERGGRKEGVRQLLRLVERISDSCSGSRLNFRLLVS